MNKINFNPQKHEKNKQIRDITPIMKKTNKSIDNFPLPKNNNSIEFPTNISPKSKQIKKRNLRTNSYNTFTHNKTESNNFNNSNLIHNKKVKSLSKEKDNFRNFINFDLNKFHNKINNNGIPFHKKDKNTFSMKGLIKSNFLGNKIIKKNGFNENENLHNSYMLSTSNLNININNVDTNQIKNKSPNNKNVKKQNFISNTCENESINFSSRKQKMSKEDIHFKIEKINNELCDLMNNVNHEQKNFIFQEIEKKLNLLLIKHNINYTNLIDNLITDNNILKEQNKEFNNKIELLENNLRNIKQENKLIKENLMNKNKIINDIQNKMILFTEEFNKLKNKNNINLKEDFTSDRINEEESDSNISLGDNLNINKYNYNNNIKSNGSVLTKPSSKLNLNLEKNKDFNDEFLENYNDFSPSWRKEVDKMLERKKNKK